GHGKKELIFASWCFRIRILLTVCPVSRSGGLSIWSGTCGTSIRFLRASLQEQNHRRRKGRPRNDTPQPLQRISRRRAFGCRLFVGIHISLTFFLPSLHLPMPLRARTESARCRLLVASTDIHILSD